MSWLDQSAEMPQSFTAVSTVPARLADALRAEVERAIVQGSSFPTFRARTAALMASARKERSHVH